MRRTTRLQSVWLVLVVLAAVHGLTTGGVGMACVESVGAFLGVGLVWLLNAEDRRPQAE